VGDKCCVSGPAFFNALIGPDGKHLQTYTNHGKVISFDAMLNTYLVQLIGIPAMLPKYHPIVEFEADKLDSRLYDSEINYKWLTKHDGSVMYG
jgi:hypothetical protein